MAIDTADKRASFFSHGGRFWMGKAYVPNGSIDAPHRLFSLTFYSGNPLSAPPPTPPTRTHDRDLLGLIDPQGDLGVLMPWRKDT